ncbi:Fungal-trans domain-containing protein [Fusarium keratoplasticum]|nr:Fungal-trans domain-containing protein [Fusarium keratoplasticum]
MAICDQQNDALRDLPTGVSSTVHAISPAVTQLGAPTGEGNTENLPLTSLDPADDKTIGTTDPFCIETFNNLIDWDYGGLDTTNITVSYILGAEMSTFPDKYTPTSDILGLFADPSARPRQSCTSPVPSDPAEQSIAECYSRAQSPPLDRDRLSMRGHGTSRTEGRLEFPDMNGFTAEELDREDHAHVEAFDLARFQPVVDLAEKINASAFFPQWAQLNLPPGEVLHVFIQLYFEHFHPMFPVIHLPTCSSPETHSLLLFAMAAIGAKYSKLKGAHKCSLAMHELVRQQTQYLVGSRTLMSIICG